MQGGQPWPPDLTRRLPAEILAMIFHHWKDLCRSKRYGLGADWVRATWICKRWRGVALESPALWSSVLISQGVTDDPVFETQLDRAGGAALDLFVSDSNMSSDEVQDALELVLAKKSPVQEFKIVCDVTCYPFVEDFIKVIAANIVSLSVGTNTRTDEARKWQFSSDAVPRLRCLTLRKIVPTSGTPLLHLAQLHLMGARDARAVPPGTGVHQFLAACPNLEVLRINNCFEYAVGDMIDRRGKDILPIVTLSKLRYLSMKELALDIATAVGTLRLPALTTFHLTGDTLNAMDDSDFLIIPQNVSEALPPLRHSRSLSLVAGGGAPTNDIFFQGSTSDLSRLGPGHSDSQGWSITLIDVDDMAQDPEPGFFTNPFCIGSITGCFLARIPHLVVPSDLVRLQLHISNGLPIARDWTIFFAAMPRLRMLGIGSGALIRLVLAAFAGDVGLCPELEDLELCVGVGLDGLTDTTGEGSALAEFILRALGTWVRGRPTPLGSLTIQPKYPDNLDSDNSDSDDSDTESSSSSSSGSESEPTDEELDDEDDDDVSERNSEPTESWAGKLYEDVQLTLEGFVHEVFLAGTDCPACGAEYEPVEWDAIARGELRDGVTYY